MTADSKSSDAKTHQDAQTEKSPLHLVICESADSEESTVTGRLFANDVAAHSDQIPPSDVARGCFSTRHRNFVVADLSEHEHQIQSLVESSSTADLAIIVVNACKGLCSQSRHHIILANLFGIRHLVLAVNKMDAIGYDRTVFEEIDTEFRKFAQKLPAKTHIESVPMSAFKGDNVVERSKIMDWYHGPTLMSFLQTVDADAREVAGNFIMPVQLVSRPSSEFQGICGTISGGSVALGDRIKALPSARESTVVRIVTSEGDLETARVGQSITLTLEDEIELSPGNVICAASNPLEVADQFEATIVWMSETPMLAGRAYAFKLATNDARVTVTALKHRINVNTMEDMAASELDLNEIGRCTISLDRRIPFTPSDENRALGRFIIIDPVTSETIGMGTLHFALRRASNIHLQSFGVDREARSDIKGHSGVVLWFTGLSGSGKSTVADILERKLFAGGHHTILLDGDNVRHGLNRDLGFTDADRVENIRRIGEVARLMTDAGLIVLVSFISPFASERRIARSLSAQGEFVEIYVSTPLAVAEARDTKGLYRKARAGDIKNFTGIDSPYEEPENAEIVVDTSKMSAEDAADLIVRYLGDRSVLKAGELGQSKPDPRPLLSSVESDGD